jgi:hypothetical protein
MNRTKLLVGLMGLFTMVIVGCAADPIEDAKEETPETAKTEQAAEENVGQTQSELKWTRPACADRQWPCGPWWQCVCNACGVEDCRNATPPTLAP